MSCANVPAELEAYADGELDLEHDADAIASVAGHLAGCSDCRAEVTSIKALSSSLRRHLPRYAANDMLRARVQTLVENFDAPQKNAPASPNVIATNVIATNVISPNVTAPIATAAADNVRTAIAKPNHSPRNWKILAIAASALLALVTAHDISKSAVSTSGAESVNRELINAHIRSLMSDHLVDVPSSDRHTVKPWFEGKINFSPAVFDFAPDSFPLAGGRLDYATGHAMAAVVFHRGQHAINLFIWPSDSTDADVRSISQDGYNIATWRRNHLRYSAVSTLNSGSLAQFAALYVARDSVTGAVQR